MPPFDRYVFVDSNEIHCQELRKLRDNYPELEQRVKIRKGDANERVISFCKATNWDDSRAVFFLDPYKTEVNWETLEAIAKTKAADLWYLFPINTTLRILQRKDSPSKSQIQNLDRMFGESDWFEAFYRKWIQASLTGTKSRTTRHANEKDIRDYIVGRLRTVFEWVDERPLRLFHSKGLMFYLLFASAIPGKRRAYQTVRDILSISSEAHDFPGQFKQLRAARKKRAK